MYEHMHVVMLKMKIDPHIIGADGVCDVGNYDSWLIAAGCVNQWQTTLQQTCAAETAL